MERRDAATDTGLGHDPNDYKRAGDDVYVSDPTGKLATKGARKGQVRWVRYRRMSSLGDITAEPLIRWKNRHVAYGMTLLETPMPFDISEKTFWDSMVDKAEQISGANLAADRGTHIHEMCARASLWWIEHGDERWEHLIEGSDELGIDRDATLHAVHGFRLLCAGLGWEPVKVEAKIVNDRLRAAGTVDYIMRRDDDAYFVIDLKGSTKLRPSYGCQLMGYGTGVPYRTEDDSRLPMPWPLEGYGYIVKFDREQLVETGECGWSVHRVDFSDAEDLLRLVDEVQHMTSPDAAAEMFGDTPHYQLGHEEIVVQAAESPVGGAEAVTAQTVADRFMSLSGADMGRVRELRLERGVAEDDYAAVLDIVNEVDPFQHDAGTGNLDRFVATPPEPVNELVVDEGDPANPNAVGLLNTRFEQLPPNQQQAIRDYVTEVGNLSISQNPSVRRFNLGAALIKIVDAVGADDLESHVHALETHTGVRFGTAGPLGANVLLDAANDLADGKLSVTWHDHNTVEIDVYT